MALPTLSNTQSSFNMLKGQVPRRKRSTFKGARVAGKSFTLKVDGHVQDLLLEEGAETGDLTLTDEQVEYLQEKFMRFCLKCQCVKPPRSHHCSKCGRCVLRMDHHCRWVDNCVGQRNLRIFLIFIFYLTAQCLYTLIVYFTEGVECIKERKNPDNSTCGFSKGALSVYIIFTSGTAILSFLVCAFGACLFIN